MKRFKNILFVHQPGKVTEAAPLRAVELARKNNARLTICLVRNEFPRSQPSLEAAFMRVDQQNMKSLLAKVDLAGIQSKTITLIGIPFIEVIKEVQSGGYDLVIKSAEFTGGGLNRFFGDTDMRLMRKCPCPVWIVKQEEMKQFSRVVAAVDPDPEVPANAELNKAIMELSVSLAAAENSELHIVHAWQFPGEAVFRSARSSLSEKEVQELEQVAETNSRTQLEQLLKQHKLEGIKSEIHLEKGTPGETIPKLVSQLQADLVVMGTVARTGIEGFIIGNTAEKILNSVDCSVLTLKPSGFESPVK